ncbi:MAG: chromosome segregation protein SMC, partial [Lachnospiraceae bacterium]|nr:chromosome segregation protein SMC [Lachnospiraceae bacterium]
DEIASYQKELEAEKNKEEEIAEKNSKLMLEQNSLDNNEQFILENIKRINDEINRNNEELQEVYESSSNVDKSIKDKQSEIEDVNNKISSSRIRIEELSAQIEKETEKKTELTKENKGFMDKREELSKQINEFDKECFRLNNQKEKLAERIDSYTSYMWEQYELTYHSAEEIKTDMGISENEMRSRIKELKSMIKNLGDVNVNAIEQYKDVNERFELLSTQHDDIIKAAEVLEGVIEELDVEMRKQFEEQFAEIKSRFDNVFKELFGGGRGTLELTDDEDILLAGIKIVAQPPGKKLQNMMQLSGGEKALTAIALLFAIQSLKPSPFCLLDEIEAALDDSNVGRYADYLHKLTKDTQFIVITHRRGTMNAADILYGITMQEKGVSTLVSVNLLDEKEIAN